VNKNNIACLHPVSREREKRTERKIEYDVNYFLFVTETELIATLSVMKRNRLSEVLIRLFLVLVHLESYPKYIVTGF